MHDYKAYHTNIVHKITLFKSEEEQPVGMYLCACATIHACYFNLMATYYLACMVSKVNILEITNQHLSLQH